MQLIPATADRFGVRDPMNPKENLRGGMTYLKWLLKQSRAKDANLGVLISAAPEVKHGQLVELLNLCQGAGVHNLQIMVKPESE